MKKFEVGDRVRHIMMNQYADVREVNGDAVLLHWGTEYSVEYTSWVNKDEIELVES